MVSECVAQRLNGLQRWSLISFRYAVYRWMRIERDQWASVQFETLNGGLGPALVPMLCSLARWTRSIRIRQNGAWKGIGGVIIEMLVSVPQTH